jgi:hypothetical protein
MDDADDPQFHRELRGPVVREQDYLALLDLVEKLADGHFRHEAQEAARDTLASIGYRCRITAETGTSRASIRRLAGTGW